MWCRGFGRVKLTSIVFGCVRGRVVSVAEVLGDLVEPCPTGADGHGVQWRAVHLGSETQSGRESEKEWN